MSKITVKENHRVVIIPEVNVYILFVKREQWLIDQEYEDTCKKIVEQAKRHVDGAKNAEYLFDTVERCSRCDSLWEVDEEDGSPLCCNKAIEEFNKSIKDPPKGPRPHEYG